jgi:hypothetical protein
MSDANSSSPLPPAPPSSFKAGGCLKFALIGCGALITLGVLLSVAAGIWWSRNSDEFEGGAQVAAREGARFGLVRDEAACFEEGKRRAAAASTIQASFTVGAFVRGCLEFGRPTPGFCDNVPPPTSIGRTAAWQSQRCGEDMICRNVSQVVQTYCTEGRPKRPAADTLVTDSAWDADGGPPGGPPGADTGAAGTAGAGGGAAPADSGSF